MRSRLLRDPERHRFVYQDAQYRGNDLLGIGVSSFSYLDGTTFLAPEVTWYSGRVLLLAAACTALLAWGASIAVKPRRI